MKVNNYAWGQMISVFLNLLDDDEKRHKHIVKIDSALWRKHCVPRRTNDATYYKAADIVGEAMRLSWIDIPEGKNITINAICWMIFNRHKEELKPYKLNLKHFEQMSRKGVSGFALESAKVLNIIEKYVKEQL